MALPWSFANAATLFTSRLDDNDNALGALTVIPCTAVGTNTIALTPAANTPTISAYTNLSPVFAFLAAASNSGATTINVNGLGAKNLYKNNGATAAGSGDIVSGGLYLCSYNSALNGAVGGFVIDNPATSLNSAITVQQFITGGPLTYTPTTGTARIRVRMCGGGGGGAGSTANNGSNGTDTSFGSWTALHGLGGSASAGAGGAGGSGGADGTGTKVFRFSGGRGNGALAELGGNAGGAGGMGGNNPFGGSGGGGGNGTAGQAGAANTGSGGGGGAATASSSGGGGGAGEYVEFWMTAAQIGASQTYTVGAGGNGGSAGGQAGGNGAAGVIIIEEYPF